MYLKAPAYTISCTFDTFKGSHLTTKVFHFDPFYGDFELTPEITPRWNLTQLWLASVVLVPKGPQSMLFILRNSKWCHLARKVSTATLGYPYIYMNSYDKSWDVMYEWALICMNIHLWHRWLLAMGRQFKRNMNSIFEDDFIVQKLVNQKSVDANSSLFIH